MSDAPPDVGTNTLFNQHLCLCKEAFW